MTQLLNSYCEKCEIQSYLPVLDIPTRWNSTLHMLENALKIKIMPALQILMNCVSEFKELYFDSNEVNTIKTLVGFLKDFEFATTVVSTSEKPALPDQMFLFEFIQHFLKENLESEMNLIRTMSKGMLIKTQEV